MDQGDGSVSSGVTSRGVRVSGPRVTLGVGTRGPRPAPDTRFAAKVCLFGGCRHRRDRGSARQRRGGPHWPTATSAFVRAVLTSGVRRHQPEMRAGAFHVDRSARRAAGRARYGVGAGSGGDVSVGAGAGVGIGAGSGAGGSGPGPGPGPAPDSSSAASRESSTSRPERAPHPRAARSRPRRTRAVRHLPSRRRPGPPPRRRTQRSPHRGSSALPAGSHRR